MALTLESMAVSVAALTRRFGEELPGASFESKTLEMALGRRSHSDTDGEAWSDLRDKLSSLDRTVQELHARGANHSDKKPRSEGLLIPMLMQPLRPQRLSRQLPRDPAEECRESQQQQQQPRELQPQKLPLQTQQETLLQPLSMRISPRYQQPLQPQLHDVGLVNSTKPRAVKQQVVQLQQFKLKDAHADSMRRSNSSASTAASGDVAVFALPGRVWPVNAINR